MEGQSRFREWSLSQFALWLLVINLGIVIGAGLYESLVLLPQWATNPPESVLALYHHNVANPKFATDSGGRFWIFVTPSLGLLSIATLLTGLKTHPQHKKWRITGASLAFVVVVFTFAWFVPNLLLLTGDGVTQLSGERIRSLTNWWVQLNWVRAALLIGAWLSALRALTKPAERALASSAS